MSSLIFRLGYPVIALKTQGVAATFAFTIAQFLASPPTDAISAGDVEQMVSGSSRFVNTRVQSTFTLVELFERVEHLELC